MDDLDFSKVNPILGYAMYSNQDRKKMNSRSAYGIDIPTRESYRDKSKD